MGRHSRRGPVAKGDTADTTAVRDGRSGPAQGPRPGQGQAPDTSRGGRPVPPRPETGRGDRPVPLRPDAGRGDRPAPGDRSTPPGVGQGGWPPPGAGPRRMPGPRPAPASGTPPHGMPRLPEGWIPDGTPAHGVPRVADGTPPGGVPRLPDGTPAQGVPRWPDGTPAHGVPRFSDGTPARGVPRIADGTPPRGVPRLPDGTPGHGVPRLPDGTPAQGVPRLPDGTPGHGFPQARGGHPEQREAGGGWGELRGNGGGGAPIPRQRRASVPGPRQEYLDAFEEEDDVFAPRTPASAHAADAYASVTDWSAGTPADPRFADHDDAAPTGAPAPGKGAKSRTFTGIAAAAVTTVLAVVVAGQVADDPAGADVQSQSATDQARDVRDSASRAAGRVPPAPAPGVTPLTYDEKMARRYPLGAALKGSGKFDAVPGIAKAPGAGQKFTYRVDVEQGLGLDGGLFADAVQKTLNDQRSWAHNGARTFERIYSGRPDFVITLASPGTTADWCAKSGLDTTVDNVSCDSAATERVMINAYRWAQGSETYGDEIHAYRQMLINHEVGHRLGYGHVTCDKDGDLAPVMQQQTKFLDHDGIRCRANPWPHPKS
ncbi:DUF3152 domain-containing protein [Streptomyces lomondensis]|uniref:DUF3152 domain-containing protein n=1 Tax=Streptomyces lomondensis TaxID=68229 RepID=A0ABQ2WZT5_9ACTN|nr:DUF3152 domain-containing protein [Streptomyces lomondensis]MCF0076231.1 DUF3152 domain-containing protein [Streptomyces lomondensis]GGW88149.1 hypothetical protein GCM10010383_16060 [Streptomyces lomondensis]